MKKYQTIKRRRFVTERKWIEEEEKVPMWWFKFLRFLFADDEKVEKWIEQEKNTAFWTAAKVARERKEQLMQEKLYELGYELQNNFPKAKLMSDSNMPDLMTTNPRDIWSIVPIKK